MNETLEQVLKDAPDNFVIQNAFEKAFETIGKHDNIFASISGGADSDVMLDLLLRCGAKEKTRFVFFDTGVEYQATKDHLDYLEKRYDIEIERHRPEKPVPLAVKEYGQPFISKKVSMYIERLQRHDFQWEDEPYEVLIERYPRTISALKWWCDYADEKTTTDLFQIKRYPYLKQFMIENPPTFKISGRCCNFAKKNVVKKFVKSNEIDLDCMGIRKAEGGARSTAYKSCYIVRPKDVNSFMPILWFRDSDKQVYEEHYGIVHSRCYTEYGLKRTGCVGCPFGINCAVELEAAQKYEPKLYQAAHNIFKDSYKYKQKYLEFKQKQRENDKLSRKNEENKQ